MSIRELMSVPLEQHDQRWLLQALQAAVELELTTIPPYLCALWSIQNPFGSEGVDPVYHRIEEIVLEEMLHMGLACNMLTTLGGTPQLNTPEAVPQYPKHLPGHVNPNLQVDLAGLTDVNRVQNVFMEIEKPEFPPVALAREETFPTIGQFYGAVLAAFEKLPAGAITGARQLTRSIRGHELFAITSLADAERAIGEIKQQGEGTEQSPEAGPMGPELAHYYQFKEIVRGRALQQTPEGKWEYTGAKIDFPAVYPMAPVPAGGYGEKTRAFNEQYTAMLDALNDAWASTPSRLDDAVRLMLQLEGLAVPLMKEPRPVKQGGNYGPDFRLVRGTS